MTNDNSASLTDSSVARTVEQAAKAIAFINPSLSTRNVGDLFIEDSAKRILRYDAEHSIDIDPRKPLTSESIDRINQCDAAVILGTNLWYRRVYEEGRWMISRKELAQIRVPIIPLGVGTTRHRHEDNSFDPESLDLLLAIHDRCQLASVRDLRTLEALAEAGIKNVVMTGCPTLFRSLEGEWHLNAKPTQRLIVTVRKGQKRNVRLLLKHLRAQGWDVLIAAQQEKDTFFRRAIPFLQPSTRTLYQFRLQPYLDCAKEFFGAIGWRLHGNMLHLAHGNPAVFFANCSRAESFCQSFGLPCVVAEDHERIPEAAIEETIGRLHDPTTYATFPSRYRYYREAMAAFLEANHLAHHLRSTHSDRPTPARKTD